MEFNIIYQDPNILVIDKPAGLVVFSEGQVKKNTLIDYLLEKFPDLENVGQAPRYGIIHRLDKDTSGILLIAKNNKALTFFQNQFKEGRVFKKYLALVVGNLKNTGGTIETLIGRSPKDRRKQKIYLPEEPESDKKRKAVTEYKILENFKNFSLIEVVPKTGRKHQIRAHLAYLGYPIAGDKLYGFKRQILP
ncbi:MAG: RNA pseudouridine synthase, partial [Candidatus Portnoybacteria bacterium CG_4_9_14_3_um_filter_43_11]